MREQFYLANRVARSLKQGADIRRNAGQIGRPLPVSGSGHRQKCWRIRQVRHSAYRGWVVTALCLTLTGCGNMGQLYLPAAGATQTQTVDAAYWDCEGQNFNRRAQDPSNWVPLIGVGAGVAQAVAQAPGNHAFIRYCMEQKGWLTRPGFEPS